LRYNRPILKSLSQYSVKSDKSLKHGPWEYKNNKITLIKDKSKIRFHIGPDYKYEGKDLYQVPYPWQKQLENELLEPFEAINEGKVIVIFDPEGRKGKTKFKKRMKLEHGAQHVSWGKTGDFMHFALTHPSLCYIFDLTRTKPVDVSANDVYSAIEQIADGCIVNMKFATMVRIEILQKLSF